VIDSLKGRGDLLSANSPIWEESLMTTLSMRQRGANTMIKPLFF